MMVHVGRIDHIDNFLGCCSIEMEMVALSQCLVLFFTLNANEIQLITQISTTCRIFSYLFSCYILSGPITYQPRPHSSTDSTSLYSHFITFFTAPHSQHGWDRWVGILTPRTCSGLYYDSKYRENMIGIGRFFMCICLWFGWGACLTDIHLGIIFIEYSFLTGMLAKIYFNQ